MSSELTEVRVHRSGEWQAGSVVGKRAQRWQVGKRARRQASSEVASEPGAQRWQASSEVASGLVGVRYH